MSTSNYEYWPFGSRADDSRLMVGTEKVAFLEAATQSGYAAFRFGINDFGARSKERVGCILERGRKRWEIRLAEGEHRRLLAYVGDFDSAGRAVKEWLDGLCAKEIVGNTQDHLITPPGAKSSYVISEEDCPT